jgi:hypothetical protein
MTAGPKPKPAVADPTASVSFKEVKAGGNINVNYIVTVGRVLELAGVEDLLPPPVKSSGFKDELDAIEATLSKPYGLDMTEAVARAGELLGYIFHNYKPDRPNEAFPFRRVLPRIASPLLSKLEELKYWDNYNERITPQSWSFLRNGELVEAEVIWLRHLETLWAKHFGANTKSYGLAKIIVPQKSRTTTVWGAYSTITFSSGESYSAYAAFVVKQGAIICEAYNPSDGHEKPPPTTILGGSALKSFDCS